MVPTNDNQEHRIGEFYEALAADYDQMTSFENRLVSERPFLRLVVEQHGITSALDAGAGTGLHSILLAQLGVRVTAVDLSASMLESLGRHAAEKKVPVEILRSSFRDLPASYHGTVDAVFSMGNTLAHILDDVELVETLMNFRRMIRIGGILFLQVLNYDRVLSTRQSTQSIRESDGVTYKRFYDFQEDRLVFNVAKIEHRDGDVEHQRTSVSLRPWRSDELVGSLTKAGFLGIDTFGSISFERFKSGSSKDLVILARNRS